jgi:hypothetical protein
MEEFPRFSYVVNSIFVLNAHWGSKDSKHEIGIS